MPDQDQPEAMDADWFYAKENNLPTPKSPKPSETLPSDELVFNPTAAQMDALTQQNQAQYLGSLKKQADVSKGAVGEVEKQGQAALAGEREKSGRAFAAQLAQGGGGSLAGMRQSQLSRGIAEGQLMGEYGMQKIAAERLASQAQSEYLAEKQKLQQAAYDRPMAVQKETDNAMSDIKNEFARQVESHGGYWSDDDKRAMANYVYGKYANAEMQRRNPALYKQAIAAVNDILAERGDFDA